MTLQKKLYSLPTEVKHFLFIVAFKKCCHFMNPLAIRFKKISPEWGKKSLIKSEMVVRSG